MARHNMRPYIRAVSRLSSFTDISGRWFSTFWLLKLMIVDSWLLEVHNTDTQVWTSSCFQVVFWCHIIVSIVDLLQYHKPAKSTRSSACHLLSLPRHNLSFGSRAFHIAAPKIWNSLPSNILKCQTLASFRRHLKTHYFQSFYPASIPNAPRFSSETLELYKSYLLTFLLKLLAPVPHRQTAVKLTLWLWVLLTCCFVSKSLICYVPCVPCLYSVSSSFTFPVSVLCCVVCNLDLLPVCWPQICAVSRPN